MFCRQVYKKLATGVRCCSHDTIAHMRSLLEKYPGGSVDLTKNTTTGVAVITLNQPAKRNAMSGHMMRDLDNAVEDLQGWKEGKAVIVRGVDKHFCAGGDFELVKEIFDPQKGGQMSQFMQQVTTRLYTLPLISVALLQGSALGGGAEIAVACDFRVMTPKAKIGFVQASLGVSPGWGGGFRLVQLLGRTKALEILSEAKALSTQQSLAYGLADHVIPDNDVLEQTNNWLKSKIQGSPDIVHAIKGTVLAGCALNMEAALELERKHFQTVWGGPDHRAAVEIATKPKS